ncbi:MAG TPA: alpha/beta hydrolase [Gemmatimonadaceae bacterium]
MSAVNLGRRTSWLACLAASLTATVAAGHNRTAATDPVFAPGPCPARARAVTGIDTSWIRCGTVVVPQNRADPSARLAPVVLSVVLYESPTAKAKTPLMFLAGGPGEDAIDVVTQVFLASPVGQLALRERPIIAFNQRGWGDSASGGSPNLGMLSYHWRATREESIETLVDSARRISARLRARGVEPRLFTTLNALDDTYDVVKALGYEHMMLFATSYGTKIALQLMRTHPTMVEAAILDGVAPPQSTDSFDPELLDQRRRVVAERLIDDCEKGAACSSEYRELRKVASALDRNDAPPVHIVVHLPSGGGWFDLDLRGRDLLSAVGAYAGTDFARAMPQVLEELAHGDTVRRTMSPELVLHVVHETALARTAGPNYPVIYHIVLCGDIPSGVLQAGGRPVCDALGVPFSGMDAINPVTSDVPTLMFSSSYDAQTPPEMAADAARTLSHAYRVLFPGIGHLAYARAVSASCVAVIAQAFLLDAAHQPPDPCSKALTPSFLPRSADLMLVPR